MNGKRRTALLWLTAGVFTAGLGVLAGRLLSPKRAPPIAPGSIARSAPLKGEAPAYLEPLAEPADAPVAPIVAEVAPPAPALVNAPTPAPAAPEQATFTVPQSSQDCAPGTRPMGDCNCYDEAKGKLSLRLEPSRSCIEAESKRLGHRVILASRDGHYELAGSVPERKPVPKPNIAAPAAVETETVEQIVVIAAPASTAGMVKPTAASVDKKSVPVAATKRPPLIEFIPASGGASRGPASAKTISITDPDAPRGTCPLGATNQSCRCLIQPDLSGKGRQFVTIIPASSAPEFCSDPSIQAWLKDERGNYERAWTIVVNSRFQVN